MSNPIDEYVKRNLASQEITPSKNLFADKIQPRIEQRKATPFPYLRVAAAVVLLLAAYTVVKLMIDSPDAQYEPQEVSPFAIEETQDMEFNPIQPPLETKANEEDVVPFEQVPENIIAQEEPTKKSDKLSPIEEDALPEQNRTIAMAETSDPAFTPDTEVKQPKKKSYKIKIKIDPAKYGVVENTGSEVASARPTVGDYARKQFQNIKEGEGLQAPPKGMIPLPNVDVRFEGNPLKKILPNKE